MDNTRFLSIIAAVIVAIVVMLIGKACTNSILSDNEKARNKHHQLVSEENYYNSLTTPNNYNPIVEVSPTEPPHPEATVDDGVEYITGILGGIKGTKPKDETIPTAPDNGGNGILDAPDPTEPATKHSILDDYNANNPTPTRQPTTTFDIESFTLHIN